MNNTFHGNVREATKEFPPEGQTTGMEMTRIIAHLCLLGCILHSLNEADAVSEFELDGDYLIGGLFDIHHVSKGLHRDKPETITCSR